MTVQRPPGDLLFNVLEPCPDCGKKSVSMYATATGPSLRILWCRTCNSLWHGKSESEAFRAFHKKGNP